MITKFLSHSPFNTKNTAFFCRRKLTETKNPLDPGASHDTWSRRHCHRSQWQGEGGAVQWVLGGSITINDYQSLTIPSRAHLGSLVVPGVCQGMTNYPVITIDHKWFHFFLVVFTRTWGSWRNLTKSVSNGLKLGQHAMRRLWAKRSFWCKNSDDSQFL